MQERPPAVEVSKTGLLGAAAACVVESVTLYVVFGYGKSIITLLGLLVEKRY